MATYRQSEGRSETKRRQSDNQLGDFGYQRALLELMTSVAEDKVFDTPITDPVLQQLIQLRTTNGPDVIYQKMYNLSSKLDELVAIAFHQNAITTDVVAYVAKRDPNNSILVGKINGYGSQSGIVHYLNYYAEKLSMDHLDLLMASVVYKTGVKPIAEHLNLLTFVGYRLLTAVVETGNVEVFIHLGLKNSQTVSNSRNIFAPLDVLVKRQRERGP